MNIKNYKTTEPELLNYLSSLDLHQQMTLKNTFGEEAEKRDIKVNDFIISLIHEGRLYFLGKPVKLRE